MTKTIKKINIGNKVLCDMCNKDYTNSDESGGFLFESKAVCPKCEPDFRKTVKKYNEEMYIKGECPKETSFKDWVINDLRGGKEGTIEILNF